MSYKFDSSDFGLGISFIFEAISGIIFGLQRPALLYRFGCVLQALPSDFKPAFTGKPISNGKIHRIFKWSDGWSA